VKHLPLFFDLAGRRVVVVGEGAAADRRADLVRSAGAHVQRLAAPTVQAADFRGAVAAFIATGDADRDAAAQRAAKSIGVPVNVADRPALCDFILPAIVDRDEIVVAVSTGGASPTLATILRGRIEAALPERLGAVARLAATFRAQVNALIGEPARRRAFFRRLVEGPAARLALAGDEAGARRAALGELDSARRRLAPTGIAHIVGAGPGDPDLLTLRAAQLLQEADAILHDDLVPPSTLAPTSLLGRSGGPVPPLMIADRPQALLTPYGNLTTDRFNYLYSTAVVLPKFGFNFTASTPGGAGNAAWIGKAGGSGNVGLSSTDVAANFAFIDLADAKSALVSRSSATSFFRSFSANAAAFSSSAVPSGIGVFTNSRIRPSGSCLVTVTISPMFSIAFHLAARVLTAPVQNR